MFAFRKKIVLCLARNNFTRFWKKNWISALLKTVISAYKRNRSFLFLKTIIIVGIMFFLSNRYYCFFKKHKLGVFLEILTSRFSAKQKYGFFSKNKLIYSFKKVMSQIVFFITKISLMLNIDYKYFIIKHKYSIFYTFERTDINIMK